MRADSERPDVRHEIVSADRNGQRLDNFLLSLLGQVPRSLIYRLVRTGQVRVNSGRAKPMQKLKTGDQVRVPPVRLEPEKPAMLPEGLVRQVRSCILEQYPDYVVLNKPAAVASVGSVATPR